MDTYNKYYNNKKSDNKKILSKYITKVLLSIVFLLICVIYIKISEGNKNNFEKVFLNNTIPFNEINNWYQEKFGNIIPNLDKSLESQTVFNEDNKNENMKDYLDGKEIDVEDNYFITSLESGVVVYIGEKEGYNNTLIIQGIDGVNIWYSNINTDNINLYDYVKKGQILGSAKDNKYYLVFEKDNKFISYEEYNKN